MTHNHKPKEPLESRQQLFRELEAYDYAERNRIPLQHRIRLMAMLRHDQNREVRLMLRR